MIIVYQETIKLIDKQREKIKMTYKNNELDYIMFTDKEGYEYYNIGDDTYNQKDYPHTGGINRWEEQRESNKVELRKIRIEQKLTKLIEMYELCKSNIELCDDEICGIYNPVDNKSDDNIFVQQEMELWFTRKQEVESDIKSLITEDKNFVDTFVQLRKRVA